MIDVVVPPHPSVQGKTKVLSSGVIRDRIAGHGESPWRDDAGAGEEHNMCLGRVEGEAALRPPGHKTVNSPLVAGNQKCRIRTPTKDRAVIGKCNSEGIIRINETDSVVEGQGPVTCRANTPLRKAHTGGALGGEMAVVVRHIVVKEVVIVSSYNGWVCPNPLKAAVDILGDNRIKGTPNVKKGSQTMGSGVDLACNIVDLAGCSSLGRPVAVEPVLLGVERTEADTLIHMLSAESLQGLQKIVGEGDRAV